MRTTRTEHAARPPASRRYEQPSYIGYTAVPRTASETNERRLNSLCRMAGVECPRIERWKFAVVSSERAAVDWSEE